MKRILLVVENWFRVDENLERLTAPVASELAEFQLRIDAFPGRGGTKVTVAKSSRRTTRFNPAAKLPFR